jgi:hypothetical protein
VPAFALEHDAQGAAGVWGGLSPQQRKAIRRAAA